MGKTEERTRIAYYFRYLSFYFGKSLSDTLCIAKIWPMGYSAFLISIISSETRTERSCGLPQSYVVYAVKVVNGDTSWVCEKRYSDFLILDEVETWLKAAIALHFLTHQYRFCGRSFGLWQFRSCLGKSFSSISMMNSSTSNIFFGKDNCDDLFAHTSFFLRRREALEEWMKSILKVACFSQSDELWHFLTDSKVRFDVVLSLRCGQLTLAFFLFPVHRWCSAWNSWREW